MTNNFTRIYLVNSKLTVYTLLTASK